MSDFGSQIIYKQLLQRHGRIRIPMIQRDYAQGRPSEVEVREEFLGALEGALRRPSDDPLLPLNLDFIYGSVEGKQETCFSPLDGQQRLTTLFLLHWYLAWNDERWDVFCELFRAKEKSRFSYRVRPTSEDFFDALVDYKPECRPGEVAQLSRLLTNQPWYFRNWRLDPTVQSTLVMLDAIHTRFAATNGLFERLTNESQPAITFQLLDLKNFGLSDDLYIKMNARGKPLTPFETFKARYEQELGNQFVGESRRIDNYDFTIADFVARRMDTAWSELFWAHRDQETNLYDSAVMNIFRAVALVTRDPESKSYPEDVSLLRNVGRAPSYAEFHSKGWLDRNFTTTLICLLEAWSRGGGTIATQLPDQRFFDEKTMLTKLVASPADLSYTEVVQFAAYVGFIREHEAALDAQAFQEWMRIIFNLSLNTDYNRTDDLQRSMAGLKTLLPSSGKVLEYFAASERPTAGFSPQQVLEEKLKAELILGHSGWRPLIDLAEGHGYFRGQIGFLLDFCGVVAPSTEKGKSDGDAALQLSLQTRFEGYLNKAQAMFSSQGLKDLGAYIWQRALLSIGDYLLPSGRQNLSFLVNSSTDQASWKRLLRGTGPKVPEARKILHQLWDRLTLDQPLEKQLDDIIKDSANVEAWRAAFVQTPSALEYCGNKSIRWISTTAIYLLSKTQMNGSHAELFTYCLYHNSLLKLDKKLLGPLDLLEYYSAIGTDQEPGVRFRFRRVEHEAYFDVENHGGQYKLFAHQKWLEKWPELLSQLTGLGFADEGGTATKWISTTDIESEIQKLAQHLMTVFPEALPNA
jgi:hypothetical protein